MSRRRDPTATQTDSSSLRADREHSWLDEVAGHKVMRRFAVGTRATLLLAHPPSRGEPGNSRPRLVKIFHPDTAASSVDVELAALSDTATPHVVRLIDVASIESGEPPCLVLERLPGPALSSYLDQRGSVSAGQAVTILAPLCATVQALHDAGVTHGAIHARRVVFDDRGAPTLTGFGRGILRRPPEEVSAAVWPPGRARTEAAVLSPETSWRAAILGDQRDLLAVVDEVLGRVDSEHSQEGVDTAALSHEIGAGSSREFLSRLERMLFAMAAPQMVHITGAPSHADPAADTDVSVNAGHIYPVSVGRSIETPSNDFDWSPSPSVSPPASTEHRLVAALRVLGVPSGGLALASSVVGATARWGPRSRGGPEHAEKRVKTEPGTPPRSLGRKPLIVGASCAVLATTILLLALPSSSGEAQAGASGGRSTRFPVDVTPSGDPIDVVETDDAPALLGDDPAEALRALSRTNEKIDAADAVVTGIWGGSALVAARINDQPASFLLVKGEAGWRVRDVFVSDQ